MNQERRIQLDLLGGFRLSHDNQEIRFPAGKAVLLLAFLACARNRVARRDRLASLFWQDSNTKQARASLRQALSRLRATLGTAREAVWSDNEQIGLTEDDWAIDIDELHHCDGMDHSVVNADWATVFLAGVHHREPAIDAWLECERQRLLQRINEVFSTTITQCLESGNASRALELGMRLSALDPFSEQVHRNLMRAYELSGDRSSALRQYRTLVRLLDEGLGISPDDESRSLFEQVRHARMSGSDRSSTTRLEASVNEPPTSVACVDSPIGLRLVTVLAMRTDDLAKPDAVKQIADAIAGQHGGDAILSHGTEALYVFGLERTETFSADAAFTTVLQLRQKSTDGQVPACGCTSGLVSIGNDAHPVGSVVQRAARLALLADSGELIVDRAIRSQLAAQVEVEEFVLRNQVSYRVLNIVMKSEARHELFGRSSELAQLTGLLGDTEHNGAAIAVLSGNAGMGKTHVTKSLELAAVDAGSSVIMLGFSAHDASPLSLIEKLVRLLYDALIESRANIDLDDMQQATLGKVLDTHRDHDRHPLRDDEHLLRKDLLIAMLCRLASKSPVLIIVEDTHWAASVDINLLIELMEALIGQAVLLLVTERRESETFATVLHSRLVNVNVLSLTLTPLSRTDACALIRQRVPDEHTQQRILERAGGHPLFLAQLAEAELDADADVPVPESVVALVQHELDRLPMLTREACLKASVLGTECLQSNLEAVFPDIRKEDLFSSKLLYGQENRICFRHALIHEAVYALLSPEERARLHLQAVHHFHSINRGELAHHALRCGDDTIAIDACALAAEWLLGENRYADAQRIVERGLQLEPKGDQRALLLLSRSQLLRDEGELDSAISVCQQAYDCAQDPGLQVRLLVRSATLLKRHVQLDRAASQLGLASRIAKENTVPNKIKAELEHEWGNNMFTRGHADKCRQHHLRAQSLAKLDNDLRMQAEALGGLGDAFYAEGNLRSAHGYCMQCIQMAESADLALISIAHQPMVGYIDLLLSPGDSSIARLYDATVNARRWKSAQYELYALVLLSEALVFAMRLDETKSQLGRIDELLSTFGGHRFAPDIFYIEILLQWVAGEHDLAYQQALKGARLYGADPYMGSTFQGILAALSDDEEVADNAMTSGENLLRQSSAAHNRVSFANYSSAYHWRHGDKTQARLIIEQAQRQFRNDQIGQFDVLLTWMNQNEAGSKISIKDATERLQQHALGIFAVTHPRSDK